MAIQHIVASLRQLPLVMIPFIVAGCATYRFGNSTLYRPDVRTVHVPVITSSSFRRHLGERLTEAVVKQVELATPYKVVNERQADSVLIVHLVDDSRHTLAETRNDDPRDIGIDLYAQVTWTDRRGNVLCQCPSGDVPMPALTFDMTQSANLVPEAGQSMSTAQQEAIQAMAQQIVAQIETPW